MACNDFYFWYYRAYSNVTGVIIDFSKSVPPLEFHAIDFTSAGKPEIFLRKQVAPLAQLDRASVYGTEGYRFEPCGVYFAFLGGRLCQFAPTGGRLRKIDTATLGVLYTCNDNLLSSSPELFCHLVAN
jgi:hypothetical protein